jgi:7,8-dihydropterin-6-yl-methyl-4-(beta-D-ribofuranosyl)aminobenzene 5'-phosphate synthase
VLGGYHLFKESASRVQAVIDRFRALGVQKVAPCHCSGAEAREMFQEEYGADYIDIRVGQQYTVGSP